MKIVIDKLLLFFLLTVLGAHYNFSDIFIVTLLVATIVSAFIFFINQKRWTYILGSMYLILCIFYPIYMIYLPLLFYDIMYYKCYYLFVLSLVGLYQFCISSSIIYSIFLISITLICILLQSRTKHLVHLEEEFKRLRDDSTEKNMLLRSQNKSLLESQEYQIHYAKLKERNRIAREIHDNVGHMLSRSILQVGALIAINKDSEMSGFLNDLKKTLSEAMTSIRSSVHNLHDEAIDLQGTIKELINGMEQYDIDFTYSMSSKINASIKYCFITTVKEALSNVVKHSNATKIIIYMMETETHFQLNIKDNGTKEKEKTGIYSPGMGLENMQERAETLGGVFRTNNVNGFQIYLSVPKERER